MKKESNMTPGKSPSLHLYGVFYGLYMIEISEDQFEELTRGAGQETDFYDELMGDLHQSIQIAGFTYSDDGPDLTLELAGREYKDVKKIPPITKTVEQEIIITDFQSKAIKNSTADLPKEAIKCKTHHFIYEHWFQVSYTIKNLKKQFDPEKLKWTFLHLKLMDGTIKKTVALRYGSLHMKKEVGNNISDDLYILTSEGVRHDLPPH